MNQHCIEIIQSANKGRLVNKWPNCNYIFDPNYKKKKSNYVTFSVNIPDLY